MHGSTLEAVQIPGSVQVPDSSAKHRRDDEVTVNSNFYEREQRFSAAGPFFHLLHHCTVLQKPKKGNNFNLYFSLFLHKTTTKHSLEMQWF